MKVLALLVLAAALLENSLADNVVETNMCRLNEPCTVSYITKGCYKDSMGDRVLPNYIYNERDSTHSNYGNRKIQWYNWDNYMAGFSCRCAKKAQDLGYDLFGVQFYGECWAGHSSSHNHTRLGSSAKCITDGYKDCGKSYRYCAGKHETNFVYQIIDTSCSIEFERVGCYKDKHATNARPLANYVLTDRDSSLSIYSGQSINWVSFDAYLPDFTCRCAKKAQENGGKYFGLQFYGECWTHPNGDQTFDRDGVSDKCIDNCYRDCGGDIGQFCVGENYDNYVYRIKEAGDPVCDVTYESVGCFTENPDDRAMRTELRNSEPGNIYFNGRVRTEGKWSEFFPDFACQCARIAKNKGWAYFGVNEYGSCYSDVASENYNKHGNSTSCREGAANAACGSGSMMCSGPDSNSNYIYKVNLPASAPESKRSFVPARDPFRNLNF